MVAYNFQRCFGSDILAGIKTSTIRPDGKRRHAGAGDQLQLYTGMRTPNCVLLLRVVCAGSAPIEIHRDGVVVDGLRKTNPAFFDTLARIEGFGSFGNLQAWFDQRYGLPAVGFTQIRWFFKDALYAPDSGADQRLAA